MDAICDFEIEKTEVHSPMKSGIWEGLLAKASYKIYIKLLKKSTTSFSTSSVFNRERKSIDAQKELQPGNVEKIIMQKLQNF